MKQKSALDIFRKKVSLRYDLIATAYHEAGHVICALLRSMYVYDVKVYYDSKTRRMAGLTQYYSNIQIAQTNNNLNYFILGEIYVNYAGLITEKILDNKLSGSHKFPSFLKNGSSDDTANAAKLISKYQLAPPGKERYKYKKKVMSEIYSIINNYWSDIELLSHLIIQNKKLYFNNIKNLLIKKSINKEFWKKKFKVIVKNMDNLMSLT